MAKYLLVVFLTVVTSILCRAQQKDEFPGLTKQDRKNYVLSVDTNQTGMLMPENLESYDKEKYDYGVVIARLSNNTNDTLKYINMTCSWNQAFITNNKKIIIKEWACQSNFPSIYKVLPHNYVKFIIPFLIPKNSVFKGVKIGFYLIQYIHDHPGLIDFDNFLKSKEAFDNCLIWSNEITMPK